MDLERDEFVVAYDASESTEAELLAVVAEQGFTARVSATAQADEDPEFFRAAWARADRENKPVVLDFTASWCAPCQRMLRETFPDEQVAPLLERFVLIKVDTDEYPALANKYGAVGLPDVRLLSPAGEELRRFRDYQGPPEFARALDEVLSEIAAGDGGDGLVALSDGERELQKVFQGDAGGVRLVLVLSPT